MVSYSDGKIMILVRPSLIFRQGPTYCKVRLFRYLYRFTMANLRTLIRGAEEQLRMNDCYYDKKDWRACKSEVRVEPQPQCFERTVPA